MLFNKQFISIRFNENSYQKKEDGLPVITDIGNLLSAGMPIDKVLKKVLSKVLKYFLLDAGRIYILDETSKQFHLVAHQGVKSRGLEKLSFDEGFSGKAAQTKSFIAQRVSELEDRKRAALLLGKGLRTILCVPLISKDKVGGVMNLATGKAYEIDQGQVDLLITIGNQIAMAVHNARLYEDLSKRIESLQEKNEIIKLFAYSVSHDLKSPATGIYGLTKNLKDKYGSVLEEKGNKYCDQIMKAAEHMVEMVEKVNAYVVAKEAPLVLQKTDMKEVIEGLKTEFSSRLTIRNITWKDLAVLPEIVADKLAIIRAFRNFIDNALKYGGDDMSEIAVGYIENNDFHIFTFRDDGVGIQKSNSKMIFERFRRLHSSQEAAGIGLGLAIVKEIAEKHGGQVWVENGTDKGVTFYFSVSKVLKPA